MKKKKFNIKNTSPTTKAVLTLFRLIRNQIKKKKKKIVGQQTNNDLVSGKIKKIISS